MVKFEGLQVGGIEGSTSIVTSDLKQKGPMATITANKGTTQTTTVVLEFPKATGSLTKNSKLECPCFNGMDFRG